MSKEKTQKGRREEIIQAALTVYSERGVFNVRIEEVASAAGIGKGTVYEYFRSKEELMSAAVRYDMEDLASHVKGRVDEEPTVRGKIQAMMETVMARRQQSCYKGFDMNPTNIGSGMEELRSLIVEQNEKWQGWLEEIIAQGVAAGEIRPVEPQMFLGAVMGAVMNMVRPWRNSVWENADPAEAARQVTELFFEGIRKRP